MLRGTYTLSDDVVVTPGGAAANVWVSSDDIRICQAFADEEDKNGI